MENGLAISDYHIVGDIIWVGIQIIFSGKTLTLHSIDARNTTFR